MKAMVKAVKTEFESGPFKLVTEQVTLENGVDTAIHVLRHPGAAAIVPFLDKKTVVMIHQYRHALGKTIWEIPAGTLDSAKESPLECARRELLEETGYKAEKFEKLGTITPSPGYSDEQIHIFMATKLTPGKQNLDRDEVLRVHRLGFDRVLSMASTGEITDSKTMAALFLASRRLA